MLLNLVLMVSTEGMGLCVFCRQRLTARRSTVTRISSESGFDTKTGLEHHSTGPYIFKDIIVEHLVNLFVDFVLKVDWSWSVRGYPRFDIVFRI